MDRRPPGVAALAMILAMPACVGIGPDSLHKGRPAYNDVINLTEDQQILQMIVRHRYDETFGMLAVTSVTASLRAGASVGANAGFGPRANYAGNLVPLSADATFEDNPTISYVPIRGEQFIERMLAPISAEQTLLLSRMSTEEVEALRLLVRRANGLANPMYSPRRGGGAGSAFDRFITLYAQLRDQGRLDIVRTTEGRFEMLIHDYAGEDAAPIRELLEALGIRRQVGHGQAFSVPVRFFVGSPGTEGLDLETPSALEVIEAAGEGVELPEPHLAAGIVRAPACNARAEFLTIRSSRERPATASVAVLHRGWWFFVDDRDVRSKQGFVFLRTLIGLRLDEGSPGQGIPLLTVPASR